MRAYIPALDTGAMPWNPGTLPGTFAKLLNKDPETGSSTAMVLFAKDAALPPGKPHYHYVDEEILVTGGALTFDHRIWLPANGYCYHPVGTVHGFHSGFDGEVTIFSRSNGGDTTKDFMNYIEGEPVKTEWYPALGDGPKRVPQYIADHRALGETMGKDGAFRTVLSRNPETGEGSMFLRLPAGWTSAAPASPFGFYREMLVMDGAVTATDGNRLGTGFYAFIPPDIPYGFQASESGALIFVSFGGGDID
jgi:quercetin dioxygenase-like cupin family protein